MQPEIHVDEGSTPLTRPLVFEAGEAKSSLPVSGGLEDDNSVHGNSSLASVEPKKVTAPPSGTLVYGRILKRTTLIPCRRDDKPVQLIETLLKTSKRSSSIGVDQIVAVINLLKPAKVLKMKSPVIKHKHVQLYDTLWMVTTREWDYFLKWLKKVGRTPTRHGKEVEHANPRQLNEEELRLFIMKFDYSLSDEDKERAEAAFLTHHNDDPYPQTPKFNQAKTIGGDGDEVAKEGEDEAEEVEEVEDVEKGDEEDAGGENEKEEGHDVDKDGDEDEDGEDGEFEIDAEPVVANMTPQITRNMLTPPTMADLKQRTEKKDRERRGERKKEKEKEKDEEKQRKDPHLSSLHDDVDPSSLHSSRIRKPYAQGLFVEGPEPSPPPPPPRPVVVDTTALSMGDDAGAKKVAFQSPRKAGQAATGEVAPSTQGQGKQKLNPHFFGHPLDLKTPHHMRKYVENEEEEKQDEEEEGDYSAESSLVSSGTDVDKSTSEGIKIDLFPGSGSAGKTPAKNRTQERYSIATSTPDSFRAPFVPTVQTTIPIGEEDIHEHDHEHEKDREEEEEKEDWDGTENGTASGTGGSSKDGGEGGDLKRVSSGLDLELSALMKWQQDSHKEQLALAESKLKEEAEAKAKAQAQLDVALKDKDQHLERLEDADRVRASLEGRLQETRTMLQILSAKDNTNDVSSLERALNAISTDNLNVPEARGVSPYPSVGSGASSNSSSRLNTPAELQDPVEVNVRKVSGGSRRRVNVMITDAAKTNSPLLSERALAEASQEVGGTDNTLLEMVTERGGEEARVAQGHALEHGYIGASELNTEEQVGSREEEALKERFLVTQDPPADTAAFDTKGIKGRDVWDTHSAVELLSATPKNLQERLGKIDTRFLTVKEKLFRPFLRVHKGTGRKLFTDPAAVQGFQQTQWEICVWTIFQIFGRAGAGDSAIVRFITQTQVNRALKEAGISADMQGKLELSLTKQRSGATKVGAAKAEAKAKMKKKKVGSKGVGVGVGAAAAGSGSGGKAEFGFSFSEFLAAMCMLVTMIRDVRYKVGGRGGRLGAARGVMADVVGSKALAPDRASSLAGEVRDDAWEVVRSQLQDRFIQICAGERGSAQAIINSKLEDTTRSLVCLCGAISEGSPYLASFPPIKPGEATEIVTSLAEIVKAPTSTDYDTCRAIWDRNAETVKTLYSSYASQLEPRPYLPDNVTVGAATTNGTSGDDLAAVFASQYQDSVGTSRAGAELMLTFDSLRSMLVDFQIFPQHIDFQSLARIYRSVKVWEWAWCDTLGIKYNEKDAFRLCEMDPLSFAVGSGNMCLTLCGFVEVMTRISHLGCDFSAEEADVGETLTYLLRLMNESHGRQMLLSGKRRSVSIRPFAVS